MKKTRQPHLTIRPMRRTDAKAVAEMMGELAALHGDKSTTTAKHFITHCLGPKKLNTAWIAYVGNDPAGFAITYDWMNFVRACHGRCLDLLYVEEIFRGHGIGTLLVSAIAKDAIKKGVQRLNTSAAITNRNANTFYKSLGFKISKHKSNRYGIDGKALKHLSKEIS